MKIIALTLGQLATNCYLVYCEEKGKTLIIDPADEGNFINQKILENDLKPVGVVATHGHFDHVLAALEVKLAFSIPFYLHKADFHLLKSHQKKAKYFLSLDVDPPPPVDCFLKESDVLKFGCEKLKVMETPGHTPGSICLFDGKHTLFTGDTVFAKGVYGRTDLSGGSESKLEKSLDKIFNLKGEITIYPGHGQPSKLTQNQVQP